jgi:hypothetical protein
VWNKEVDRIYDLGFDQSSGYKLCLIRQPSLKIVPKASTTAHTGRYKVDPVRNEIVHSNFRDVSLFVRIVELRIYTSIANIVKPALIPSFANG